MGFISASGTDRHQSRTCLVELVIVITTIVRLYPLGNFNICKNFIVELSNESLSRYFTLNQKYQPHGGTREQVRGFILWGLSVQNVIKKKTIL